MLAYACYEILPAWHRYFQGASARELKRNAAIAFLDAFLITYLIALCMMLGVPLYLVLRQAWRALPRPSPRLLLLCGSGFACVLILESSAAAWRVWLHRDPRLSAEHRATKPDASERHIASVSSPDYGPKLPDRFPGGSTQTAAPLKLLVIGESSGRGEPYHPWLSVGQIVAWRLKRVWPGRSIDVDIWATGGATLEMMHQKLAGLTYRPDALIVYVGHNEFQARYTWMRDVDYYLDTDLPPRLSASPWVLRLQRVSPLCRLITETRERHRVDIMPPRAVTRDLVDRPVCTAAETVEIVADFRRRLEAVALYCELIGTLPILIIPPSNDAGFDPSRSALAADTPESERLAFARAVARTRALEMKDRAQAINGYRELTASHPEFAETHFRLARLLEQTGRWEEARTHYVVARETDAMPLRCPEPLRDAYRAVAARHPTAILIDGPKILAAKSRHGIVDDRFFHDAQHPNLRGYACLAEEILNQLAARHAMGWPAGAIVPVVDLEACSAHFELDAARWERICSRGRAFFRATSYIRYDPGFRNERAALYDQSSELIRAGVDPADAAIPGWPLNPRPATTHRIPLE